MRRRFEDKDDHLVRRRVSVVLGDERSAVAMVMSALAALPATLSEIEYERRLDDGKKPLIATFDVQFVDKIAVHQLVEAIEAVPGVRRVHVQQAH